jgi:hypothetical protein
VKEPAEMEVASVFEEVATRNAVIADVTVAFEIPAIDRNRDPDRHDCTGADRCPGR